MNYKYLFCYTFSFVGIKYL